MTVTVREAGRPLLARPVGEPLSARLVATAGPSPEVTVRG